MASPRDHFISRKDSLFIRFIWVHEMREIIKMRIGAHGDSVICLGLTLGRLVY